MTLEWSACPRPRRAPRAGPQTRRDGSSAPKFGFAVSPTRAHRAAAPIRVRRSPSASSAEPRSHPRKPPRTRAVPAGCAGRRAAPRLRPLRRPGRLYRPPPSPRRRGGARAPLSLLRDRSGDCRALRRHRREVHRRRGHGVWGTPVATEDDAERAVGGLDLVAAVPELDAALKRAPASHRRAAVTLGAEGQGMVAGDLVNTASRIQSAAEPGAVLVGDAPQRASEAAIAYPAAGMHELKGKSEPAPLWRAFRVTSGRNGAVVGRARGAFVRARSRLRSSGSSTRWPTSRRPICLRDRHRWDRQVVARLGVLRVHRRPAGRRVLASRTLPCRRRRGFLALAEMIACRRDRRGRSARLGRRLRASVRVRDRR